MLAVLIDEPRRLLVGQAELRRIEESWRVEGREAGGCEVAVAAQVERELDRLAELDHAAIGRDLEAEVGADGAGEARGPAFVGQLRDLDSHGSAGRERARRRDRAPTAEEVLTEARAPLDGDRRGLRLDPARPLRDQRPLGPQDDRRSPPDVARLARRPQLHDAARGRDRNRLRRAGGAVSTKRTPGTSKSGISMR